jgi:hypothetical protein
MTHKSNNSKASHEYTSQERITALLAILGWPQGTVQQIANTLGLKPEQLLHGKPSATHLSSDHNKGWFAVNTCSREHAMINLFPSRSGNLDYWIGAAEGFLCRQKLTRNSDPEATVAPFDPQSPSLTYNPDLLKIERIRMSTTQGSVKLSYAGLEITQFGDTITLQNGEWKGHPDEYWQKVGKDLFEQGHRHLELPSIANTIKSGMGMTMDPLYYGIAETLGDYKDSPVATAYLRAVIDRSCPDNFHWTDLTTASDLKNRFGDRSVESLSHDELRSLGSLFQDRLDELEQQEELRMS